MSGVAPVALRSLTKQYGRITAVDDVSLTVNEGDVFGYLGPNGAGKTTSLRMMLGLIRPTAGEVLVFGQDPQRSVKALADVAGFVEAPRFYPYLDANTNLRLVAALDGNDAKGRIAEALDIVELSDRAGDKVGGFSHGMHQRLGIAGALIRRPRLLLLDEPTTGLDPGGMRDMRALIARLSSEGMTVMLSSHLLAEVEELCNRVAIVRSGRIVYEGELNELRAAAGLTIRLRTTDDELALRVIAGRRGISDVVRHGSGAIQFRAADETAVAELSRALADAEALILELAPSAATLEDLFFELTEGDGDSADEAARLDQAAELTGDAH